MSVQPPNQDDRFGNKRRKIDPVAAAHLYPTAPSSHQHHVPVSPYTDGVAGHYVARQSQNSPQSTPYSDTPNAQQGQWVHSFSDAPQSYAPIYRNPRSMQHAYYYGQTDPSVGNSPWQTSRHDAQSSVHIPSIPPTSQAQAMTYMQPTNHSPADSQQSYDTGSALSYATALHDSDNGSLELGHDVHSHQPHQQHQIGKIPLNTYCEDASMHLKVQILPVLDSLVSVTRPLSLRYIALQLVSHRTSVCRGSSRLLTQRQARSLCLDAGVDFVPKVWTC